MGMGPNGPWALTYNTVGMGPGQSVGRYSHGPGGGRPVSLSVAPVTLDAGAVTHPPTQSPAGPVVAASGAAVGNGPPPVTSGITGTTHSLTHSLTHAMNANTSSSELTLSRSSTHAPRGGGGRSNGPYADSLPTPRGGGRTPHNRNLNASISNYNFSPAPSAPGSSDWFLIVHGPSDGPPVQSLVPPLLSSPPPPPRRVAETRTVCGLADEQWLEFVYGGDIQFSRPTIWGGGADQKAPLVPLMRILFC